MSIRIAVFDFQARSTQKFQQFRLVCKRITLTQTHQGLHKFRLKQKITGQHAAAAFQDAQTAQCVACDQRKCAQMLLGQFIQRLRR